jgi:hypothetical protein
MDWLFAFVLVAIAGQFGVIVWLKWRAARRTADLPQARARLVEAAADQQLQTQAQHTPKLGSKGVVDE